MAERILGHWESSSGGAILTLDLDGRMMNPGGEVIGNSSYTLVGDVISYWQGGQLFSARVTFPSPGEMVWSGLAFGRIGRFTRKRIVLPRREEVYASIQGHWQGQGDIRALEVVPERLKLTFADGRQAEENYLISGLRLSFNLEGEVQHFAIEVAGDELTLTKSYTGSRQSFTRPAASPPSQELGRQSPSVATGTAPAP